MMTHVLDVCLLNKNYILDSNFSELISTITSIIPEALKCAVLLIVSHIVPFYITNSNCYPFIGFNYPDQTVSQMQYFVFLKSPFCQIHASYYLSNIIQSRTHIRVIRHSNRANLGYFPHSPEEDRRNEMVKRENGGAEARRKEEEFFLITASPRRADLR